MKKGKAIKRSIAGITSAALMLTGGIIPSANAAVIDKENPNNYHNYAEALQYALCFYDANKCGDKVGEDQWLTEKMRRQPEHPGEQDAQRDVAN